MIPFLRKKHPRRQPDPRPSWLKWLLLAFVLYAVYLANTSPQGVKSIESAKTKLDRNEIVNIAGYKDKLFPEFGAGLRISDTLEGEGRPAVCGQRVAVAYQAYLAQGNELPDFATHEHPLIFNIGDGKVMPVFDRGAIGMKNGGKRSIIAPPLMSYGLEDYKRDDVPGGATVRFEMEMLSIDPALPDIDAMPYRLAEIEVGNGGMLICGEPAKLRLKIWDMTGKLLYSNHADKDPLTLTPGRSEAMLGLEQGIIGMLEGGTRLLIVPPAFQRTMSGEPPKFSVALPKDEVVMVEVVAESAQDDQMTR